MYLYAQSVSGPALLTLNCYEVALPWSEAAACWSNTDTSTDGSRYLSGYTRDLSAGAWHSWDVTGAVENWVHFSTSNRGVALVSSIYKNESNPGEGQTNYSSSEFATAAQHPKLEIEYDLLPSAILTEPVNGSSFTVTDSVTLTATASDADGSVSRVEFYRGSTRVGEDSSAPYTYALGVLAAGTYSVYAVAVDNQGAEKRSSTAVFFVTGGATFALRGCVSDVFGHALSGITVSISGDYMGSCVTDGDGRYVFANLSAGDYILTASAAGKSFVPERYTCLNLAADSGGRNFTLSQGIDPGATVQVFGGDRGYVNPVKGESFRFSLNPSVSGEVTCRVYSLSGTLVWEEARHVSAGAVEIVPWNGRNPAREPLASGIYILRVRGGGINSQKKLAIIK